MNTCSFTYITLHTYLPCRVTGIERTWDYLKTEFDREGDGLPDPAAKYFETIGPGPQLFAVIGESVYYHDTQQWFKFKSSYDIIDYLNINIILMRRLIVVVGINGRQGSSVVEALLEYSDQWLIRGTTTDTTSTYSQELAERGVEIMKCDISNQEECCRAFVGAYGIFSINKYWDAEDRDEYKQAINIVEAAKKANVQHIITSGLPDTTAFERSQFDIPSQAINKTQIEDYIRSIPQTSTFPYITFIQMGFYYQNFIMFFVLNPTMIEFRYPILSQARIPLYDVRDTGKVVRECFLDPQKWGNSQRIPIVAEQLTMEEICKIIQEVTRKNIHFVPLTYDEALRKLHKETVNNLKWYNDIGSIDGKQAEKTNEIWPKMNKFADWLRETQWLIE